MELEKWINIRWGENGYYASATVAIVNEGRRGPMFTEELDDPNEEAIRSTLEKVTKEAEERMEAENLFVSLIQKVAGELGFEVL